MVEAGEFIVAARISLATLERAVSWQKKKSKTDLPLVLGSFLVITTLYRNK